MNKTVIHSLTGLFLLVALFAGGVAILSRATLQRWLGTVHSCEVWLPEAYVKPGDGVEFRSFRVGQVERVEARPWDVSHGDRWFRVQLAIESDWADAITDAFTLTVSLGPLGALTGTNLILLAPDELATLDADHPAMQRGRALADFAANEAPELRFQKPVSLLDELSSQAEALLDRLGPEAEKVIAKFGSIADELARSDGDLFTFVRLLRQTAEGLQQPLQDAVVVLGEVRTLMLALNDPEGPVQRVLAHAAELGAAIERGEGVVGGLLRDGEIKQETVTLFRQTNALLDETRALLARTQTTLGDVNLSSAELPAIVRNVGVIVADLGEVVKRLDTASRVVPGLTEDVRRALEQTNLLMTGLRESRVLGLFADFSPPPPGEPLVLPAALGGGVR